VPSLRATYFLSLLFACPRRGNSAPRLFEGKPQLKPLTGNSCIAHSPVYDDSPGSPNCRLSSERGKLMLKLSFSLFTLLRSCSRELFLALRRNAYSCSDLDLKLLDDPDPTRTVCCHNSRRIRYNSIDSPALIYFTLPPRSLGLATPACARHPRLRSSTGPQSKTRTWSSNPACPGKRSIRTSPPSPIRCFSPWILVRGRR